MSVLEDVARVVAQRKGRRTELTQEAAQWVAEQMDEFERDVARTVLLALEDHSVSDVARAYTGSTAPKPNRTVIYDILRKYRDGDIDYGNMPFGWVPREIKTKNGKRTVWDAFASVSDYGPDKVSGEFTWRYDNGQLDEVIDPVEDPWPSHIKYYEDVLATWLTRNPYPEESE